jgi:drug/metabolite transporter superfamily protein YnfA
VPLGLILLSFIPIVSGSLRLTQLGGGPEIIPEASRFTVFPWPVVVHIVSATLFSIVGAFQFVPALRRGRRSWHKAAGRMLLPAGFLVALSGLWMAAFSELPVGDGPLLLVIRLGFGTYMLVCLSLAVRALVRRQFSTHGAWMTRAYAIAVAAGTQAIFLIPVSVILGSTHELGRALTMGAAWAVNLAVAELVIRRRNHLKEVAR